MVINGKYSASTCLHGNEMKASKLTVSRHSLNPHVFSDQLVSIIFDLKLYLNTTNENAKFNKIIITMAMSLFNKQVSRVVVPMPA